MLKLLIFTTLFLHILEAQSKKCVNSPFPKIRVFENLLDLQSNKDPFRYGEGGSKGNYVVFKDDNIPVVAKNAFITYDSENIQGISLDGKQIQEIQGGAFYQLDCLSQLDLSNNSISAIAKEVFVGLGALTKLDLSKNLLEEVPEQTFTYVPRLTQLSLASNRLRVLHPDSFFNLWLLEKLDLSNNQLEQVLGQSLQYFKSLIYLQLGSNKIEDLRLEHWTNAFYLRLLNLTDNALESFDMSIKYSFRHTLTKLYLNKNSLTTLFVVDVKKRFPVLNKIDINDNRWNCSELSKILEGFKSANINYSGNAATAPNVEQIACDRPTAVKEDTTSNAPILERSDLNSTDEVTKNLQINTVETESRVGVWKSLLITLFVILLVCIAVIIYLKIKGFNWFRRRRQYTQIANVSLNYEGRYCNT